MPILADQDVETMQAGSNYQFSATKIDRLGASEYTLVEIKCDASSSVDAFEAALHQMLKTILESLQKSPRRDNLMLRLSQFASGLTELHGYKLLSTIKADDYDGILKIGGMTSLFDATDEGINCMSAYARSLTAQDFTVNGIIFIITDGQNNQGRLVPADIAKSIAAARKSEVMESITVVLVGVTSGSQDMDVYLKTFHDEAKLDQYVNIGSATPGRCAKLAGFVSQSVSSTSQALGSGGPSQPIAPKF